MWQAFTRGDVVAALRALERLVNQNQTCQPLTSLAGGGGGMGGGAPSNPAISSLRALQLREGLHLPPPSGALHPPHVGRQMGATSGTSSIAMLWGETDLPRTHLDAHSDADSQRFLLAVMGRVKKVVGELGARDVAQILKLSAKLGVVPGVDVLDVLLGRALELAGEFTSEEAAEVLPTPS